MDHQLDQLRISELQDNMKLLTTENTVLHSRMDALEVYMCVDNLVIKGLPETYTEAAQPPSATESESATVQNGNTTIASVVQFCNTQLNIEVSPMHTGCQRAGLMTPGPLCVFCHQTNKR